MYSYLNQIGPDLIEQGYDIIPIKPGHKHPEGLDNWQNIKATQSDISKWASNGFRGGGVGVLCGRVIAVDIDVFDQAIVDKIIDWCELCLGSAPQRVGRSPKTMLVFRTDEPFRKLTSVEYNDFLGHANRLEILGQGQQFVAYAVHPQTNKPYQWVNGPGLSDINYKDLPVLNHGDAVALLKYFESIKPDDWEIARPNKSSLKPGKVSSDPFENVMPKTDLNTTQIKQILNNISELSDDRDDWVIVGMALHHQYDGDSEGFELWDEWSQNSTKYKSGEPERLWGGFAVDLRRTKPTTFARVIKIHNDVCDTPFKAANNNEKQHSDDSDPVSQFIDRYIFVEQGNQVCDTLKPPQYSLSRLEEFKNRTANIRHEVPAPTVSDPEKVKMQAVHNSWLVHPKRKSAEGEIYHPCKARIYVDEKNLRWINTFYMPEFDRCDGNLDIFLEHMEYLIPAKNEREWFINWIAFNVQFPQERSKVSPLHVSNAHGTGRGWVVELLGKLLGVWNCKKAKMANLCGDNGGSQFQDYLYNSLLCSIEEAKEGNKRYGVSDRIRDILTEKHLNINIKYGTQSTREVFTNFFFMTNHVDAFVLTEEDRRIQVLSGPSEKKDVAYYNRLYAWSEHEKNLGALDKWLRDRDISKFDWKHSTDTPGRRRMIEYNRTPTEVAFWDTVKKLGKTAILFNDLIDIMRDNIEGDIFENPIEEKQVIKLLQQNANNVGLVKYKGKPVRPWLLNGYKTKSNAKIRTLLDETSKKVTPR